MPEKRTIAIAAARGFLMGAIASAVSTTQKLGTIARVEWVQMMRQQLSAVRWKRLSLTSVAGIILLMAAMTAYDQWRKRDGWCVRFYPDGSEKIIYGIECQRPIP
jgi:hypothetical protein